MYVFFITFSYIINIIVFFGVDEKADLLILSLLLLHIYFCLLKVKKEEVVFVRLLFVFFFPFRAIFVKYTDNLSFFFFLVKFFFSFLSVC